MGLPVDDNRPSVDQSSGNWKPGWVVFAGTSVAQSLMWNVNPSSTRARKHAARKATDEGIIVSIIERESRASVVREVMNP